jgi:GNAT superfamily N-acetyltransferase
MVSGAHVARSLARLLSHGSRLALSAARIRKEYLYKSADKSETCSSAMAHIGDISTWFWYPPGNGYVTWITQLVVDQQHRSKGIATALIRKAWDTTQDFACGLVSSHPHAVRALETAIRRLCDPAMTMEHGVQLLELCGIPYLKVCKFLPVPEGGCTLNTSYYGDHTEVNQLVA